VKSGNIVRERSYSFALKIIKVFNELKSKENEQVMSHQLLKCGTSIGANIEEALGGQRKILEFLIPDS